MIRARHLPCPLAVLTALIACVAPATRAAESATFVPVEVASGARLPGAWGQKESFDHDLFWHERDPAIARRYLAAWQAVGQETGWVADPRISACSRTARLETAAARWRRSRRPETTLRPSSRAAKCRSDPSP